jgi:hypothetical protein
LPCISETGRSAGPFTIEQREPVNWRDSQGRRKTMPEQFENREEVKVKDETASDETARQKIDRVADKLAKKPGQAEKKFDKENSVIFNK